MFPRLFRALIFFATLGLSAAIADDWISDRYKCAMTLPLSESWLPGSLQGISHGEIVFHQNYAQNSEGIVLIVVPEPPTSDMGNDTFTRSIGEVLMSVGFAPESYKQFEWLGRPGGQFIARRKEAVFGSAVGIARATVFERNLYIVMAYGKGEADRVDDKRFTRVLDTFRFVEKGNLPTALGPDMTIRHYKIGAVASAAAAGLLAALFCVVMFLTRPVSEEGA